MKFENLCVRCMKEKSSPNAVCEHCGFDASDVSIPSHHLEPYTILAGKYMLGLEIGEGGFGITYIGMDLNLEMRVAVKEFYPYGCAVRDTKGNGCTVHSCSGDMQQFFEIGREKFINEARILAKCVNLPGIVTVRDFFKENHTAYIVMEYIEGETLKTYLQKRGRRISAEETLRMMKPVIQSLGQVHRMNLIHRDISPDNIMIRKNGVVKVLDFGGAREFIGGKKSLSVMMKPGYTPEEQYRTHGEQGAWTDVYAICATMYRCITGETPPEAMERTYQDQIKPFSAFQVRCPKQVEHAIFKGLSIYKDGRFQSMEELYQALYGISQHTTGQKKNVTVSKKQPENTGKTPPSNRRLKVIAAILGCVLVLLTGVMAFLIFTAKQQNSQNSTDVEKSAEELADDIIKEVSDEISDEESKKEPEEERTSFFGHHYQIFDDEKDIRWTEAKVKCEEMGGHLVAINSEEEQHFVESLIDEGKRTFYWIGATDSNAEPNAYYWVTGEPFSYKNWLPGQPDNGDWGVGGTEDYVGMLRVDVPRIGGLAYTWNDFRNRPSDSRGYVCEWDD